MEFLTGTMFGGKSAGLVDRILNDKEIGIEVLCFKPAVDTRDGMFIKSRDYWEEIPALPLEELNIASVKEWGQELEALIYKGSIQKIYVDEVQFLPTFVVEKLVEVTKHTKIELVVAGLVTDFRGEVFPSARTCLEATSDVIFYNGKCNSCKGKAVHNVRTNAAGQILTEGEAVEVGSDQYQVLCNKCYKERTSL